MNNPPRPIPTNLDEGSFIKTSDGTDIFVHTSGLGKANRTIYVISGYTGINHNAEKDVLTRLTGNDENRIVVIHPRGTGYSEGKRGDVKDYDIFIDDFIRIINADIKKQNENHKVILYGHSISTALCLAIQEDLSRINGIILVNPPFIMKKSKGMMPSLLDFLKYAGYMIFAPHSPIVNMAGDPRLIVDEEDRAEAEKRNKDPLLVKYISMYMMLESKKLLDQMAERSKKISCPLLLIYGSEDSLVDRQGCDKIFTCWKGRKEYEIVKDGPHGSKTVLLAMDRILEWVKTV
jgi:pimeloyl-ACP methyl ester carboxylesterase